MADLRFGDTLDRIRKLAQGDGSPNTNDNVRELARLTAAAFAAIEQKFKTDKDEEDAARRR